nr:hypothetical protein [uncultured Bdellovibrio sp.]
MKLTRIVFVVVCALGFHSSLFAQQNDASTAPPVTEDNAAKPSGISLEALRESRQRRSENKYYVLGNYAPLDLILPSKIGVTAGLNDGAEKSWELEYLRGSFGVPVFIADLGSITEQRISLTKRSFFGNETFNISYGISYFSLDVHLGDKFVNNMSGHYPSAEVVGMESWGVHFALGNRWTIKKNITFGVDWFSWAQPVILSKKDDDYVKYATNDDYKDDVDTALNIAAYLPRISLLKLQLGIMF